MNLPQTDTSVFNRLRVVLVETSRAGNVGAVARAMKTMGFSDLVLVNPRDAGVLAHEEAVAFASGALDILAGARIVGSMAEALEGCRFAAAVSARLSSSSPLQPSSAIAMPMLADTNTSRPWSSMGAPSVRATVTPR